jgi:pimeloyl-ACP methyl ester carboxylesterase
MQLGNGSETILAFHGFGRHAKDFIVFEPLLRANQRIISVNLFAHGKSVFPEERIDKNPITKSEWHQLLSVFLTHLGIEKFHLLGYSMGGRICLTILEIMPQKILDFLLIAPDGLKLNWLYRFASGTMLGRKIYRSIIDRPRWLFVLAKILNKTGILNDKLHRFVHVHLDTREKRQLVYDAWLIYKKLFPNLELVAQAIIECQLRGNLIFGEYDSVITPRLSERLTKKTGTQVKTHLIKTGHRLITVDTAAFIRQQGIWPGSEHLGV